MADPVIDKLYTPLSSVLAQDVWPADVLGTADFSFLDGIAYVRGSIFDDELGTNIELDLEGTIENVFELPFGAAIVVGEGPILARVVGNNLGYEVTVDASLVKLRLPRALFVPVVEGDEGPEADPDPEHFVEISFPFGVDYDSAGNLAIRWPLESERTALRLPRCMLGETGIIISAEDVIVRLAQDQALPDEAFEAGVGPNFRGVYLGQAKIELPEGLASAIPAGELLAEKCFIGTGGFTGSVTSVSTGSPPTELFGAEFTFESLTLEIKQNALTTFEIRGALQLEFFDDPLDVVVSIDLDGTILIRLANEGGLVTVGVEDVFTFTIDKIEFEVEDDGDLLARTSGTLTPTFQPPDPLHVDWPGFRLENLEIDSDGNVRIAGGWIDLPEQASLSLFGFIVEITRLGFGKTEEGRNWIGFNGAVRILEGIPAGASVEGVRIIWGGPIPGDPTRLTLEGVGVDVTIPGVVRFAGKVSLTGAEFKGAVLVELPAISFQLEGQFVAGTIPDTNIKTYGLFLQMQLPAGIPLGPTGLAFYGLAGLYAHNREPNKLEGEGWYRSPDLTKDGWFTRAPAGVTDLGQKWRPSPGHTGLGAGIIIGTFPDNGYMFNGRLLLVLVFPGPVILLEGMANLFKRRTALGSGDEPNFHALVVIEPGKSFLAGLDAQYRFADGGELMEIRGSAEAFFSYGGASPPWFINLGVDSPFERRISARIFQLFDVGGFFMLDPTRLFVGAGWRYHKRYGWKHLNVTLSASMEGNALVSWHPAHFTGSVSVEGSAELRAFSISAGISVGATISGDVFDPFGLRGEFRARLNLPWPLPDIKKTIVIEWKHDFSSSAGPPLPVPLREAAIEHLKSRNTWALERGKGLLANDGGFDFERPGGAGDTGAPDALNPPFAPGGGVPRIPADSKVALTFTRPMRSPFLLAVNETDVEQERIGDPRPDGNGSAYTTLYSLLSIELQKWAPGNENSSGALGWVPIQRAGEGAVDGRTLVGAWVPGLENPAAGHSERNKLLINATTPFAYTSGRSTAWEDWLLGANPNFACPLPLPSQSAHFTQPIGTQLDVLAPDTFKFDVPAFEISSQYGGDITANDEVIAGLLGPIDRGARYLTSPQSLDDQISFLLNMVVPPPGATKVGIRVGMPAEHEPFGQYGLFIEFQDPALPLGGLEDLFTINAFRIVEGVRLDRPPPRSGVIQGHVGLVISDIVEIFPDAPLLAVELVLVGARLDDGEMGDPSAEVALFDTAGSALLGAPQQVGAGVSTLRFKFPNPDIARIVLTRNKQDFIMERITPRAPITAVAKAASNPSATVATVVEQNGSIDVEAADLGRIFLFHLFGGDFTLLEMTVPGREGEIVQHTLDSLVHLTKEDPLFEPENDYRLVVTTTRDDQASSAANAGVLDHNTTFIEHAYFHVVGPPGIETPEQPPPPNPEAVGEPGLGDLRLYVEQTLPPSIPLDGGKLLLPRAFYRGYDVAVKFNEPYTELFYLRAHRSLTVRLYDVDDNPVLMPDGRVSIPVPSWERSRVQEVSESVSRWIAAVDQMACHPDDVPPFDSSTVVRPQVLSSPGAEVVLAPETLHQARLVPSLVHETFVDPLPGLIADGASHRLERWVAENTGGGPSHWQIDSDTSVAPPVFFVKETTGNPSTLFYVGPLGAVPSNDSPSQWSDFRASVVLRWGTGLVAFDVRRSSSTDFLRVTLDRSTGSRRLFVFGGGASSLIKEDSTTFPDAGTDVELTIECVGDRVQVFQDGGPTPIFDATGMPAAPGTVALHVEGATPSRFTEIRVEDLRPTPSAAFTFDFVSSKYTNFHHHLHSFSDRVFDGAPAAPLTAADLAAHVGNSVAIPAASTDGVGTVTDAEWRSFDALEAKAFGPAALAPPAGLEITRVSQAGAPTALFVRSPEPLLWERTLLEVSSTSDDVAGMDIPGDLKLTGVTFGAAPADESVTILVRARTSLAFHRLEWRPLPDTSNPDPAWNLYFEFDESDPELEEGTEVRVLAVAATEAPQREPGTTQRFVAAVPADALVQFNVPGVELRLLAPDETTVAHERRFPTADAFAPFPMRAVRKLDGTALVLFVSPDVTVPAPAALRLRWTFNRAVGDENLRFRQGGSETPELAVLDFVLTPAV